MSMTLIEFQKNQISLFCLKLKISVKNRKNHASKRLESLAKLSVGRN